MNNYPVFLIYNASVLREKVTFEWKGFASSLDALNCMNIVLLAQQGMTVLVALSSHDQN